MKLGGQWLTADEHSHPCRNAKKSYCHSREASPQTPDPRDQRPETRDQKPETRNQRPETRNQKPETRDQRPETRNQKPETRDQKPETREAAQFIRALRDSELKATGEAGKRQKENQKKK